MPEQMRNVRAGFVGLIAAPGTPVPSRAASEVDVSSLCSADGGQDLVNAPFRPPTAPRRYEALAFIMQQIVQTGTCPSIVEIGEGIGVQRTRARELMAQLCREGIIDRVPGKKRSFRVRDVVRSRMILEDVLRNLGWSVAMPLGSLSTPRPNEQLPMLPPFEHLPDA